MDAAAASCVAVTAWQASGMPVYGGTTCLDPRLQQDAKQSGMSDYEPIAAYTLTGNSSLSVCKLNVAQDSGIPFKPDMEVSMLSRRLAHSECQLGNRGLNLHLLTALFCDQLSHL